VPELIPEVDKGRFSRLLEVEERPLLTPTRPVDVVLACVEVQVVGDGAGEEVLVELEGERRFSALDPTARPLDIARGEEAAVTGVELELEVEDELGCRSETGVRFGVIFEVFFAAIPEGRAASVVEVVLVLGGDVGLE
jgi:hypothetical protein